MDFISLSLDLEEWVDMTKALCLKVFYLKKEKESNEGSFPGKRGGSLGSLKYQVFPCQNVSLKTSHNSFSK